MTQTHVIKRQIIELTIQDAAQARRLHDEAGRIYRERIVPLIDRYCTELSEPGQLHRIESLELDVGAVDAERFEAELVAKVSVALRQALAARIGEQGRGGGRADQSPTAAESQLELFALFARTGSLPWWADASAPRLLERCLESLLDSAPARLRRLMRELAREPGPLRRIVLHISDRLLGMLARILAPAAQAPQALIDILQKITAASGRTPAQLRLAAWLALLRVAGVAGQQYAAAGPFYQAVLQRVATDIGTDYAALLAEIYQVVQSDRERIRGDVEAALEALYWEWPGAQTTAAEEALSNLWTALRALESRLAAPLREELLAAFSALEADMSTDAWAARETARRILGLLPAVLAGLPPTATRDLLAALRRLAAAAGLPAAELAELERARELPGAEDALAPSGGAVDISFGDADELYIGNAGLVILWPFLGHFFAHLGLLEGKQFADRAARSRAAGLLQYIATEEPSFPEYLLPLNKVLCGLELTEVFDLGPPLLEAEAAECANLLAAAIAQAPILRDMSAAGFRGSFLLREGVLSARDGAWLLRVERRTYDVVLERFPWSWGWVKLPWMTAPLRVEW